MEIRVLNYFLTVAREKTISKAAMALHLSQPTLSKQLKELKEELGVQLFIRGNRKIVITEEGNYLVNRGKEILSLIENTTSNIQSNELIIGEITVGDGETRAFEFISSHFTQLQSKFPEIKINLYSGHADDVLDKIDKGLLDFRLVINPVEKQKYDYIRLSSVDNWGILVNNENLLATKKIIIPKDISGFPLLLSNQSLVNNQFAEWLGKSIDFVNVIGTYNLLFNASLLVKQNTASAVCIDGIIETKHTNLTFVPFSPSLTSAVNIIWKKIKFFLMLLKHFYN